MSCSLVIASSVAIVSAAAQGSGAGLQPGAKPPRASAQMTAAVGEYDSDRGVVFVIEDGGRLWLVDTAQARPMRMAVTGMKYVTATGVPKPVSPRRYPVRVNDLVVTHREVGPTPGTSQLKVTPVRPVSEIRVEALGASPPAEPKAAKPADLVELTTLDPTIKLEIRYATTNNFLGTKFYDEARAFMQRPAAEAVVRANKALRPLGYGLLIHDAYRPWYVTKMFWDATPVDKRWLVANPAEGSKHNRGAAVDLTLFDLATGRPIDMPSTYDESTGRAYADYPGGTSLQRWHRALLRRAMEAEGFVKNPSEWWHFDYTSWRDYAIGNVPFDRIR
ncbi:MAG: M15 family metallopeptidase [bacterium]